MRWKIAVLAVLAFSVGLARAGALDWDAVRLNDGSVLIGYMDTCDKDSVTMTLGYAGGLKVKVPRGELAEVVAVRGNKPLGPGSVPADLRPYQRDAVRMKGSGSVLVGKIVAHDSASLTILIGRYWSCPIVVPFDDVEEFVRNPHPAPAGPDSERTDLMDAILAYKQHGPAFPANANTTTDADPAVAPTHDQMMAARREAYKQRQDEAQERGQAFVDARRRADSQAKVDRREARDAYMERVRPQLVSLDAQIADAQARGQAAEAAVSRLREQQATAMALAYATMQNDRNIALMNGHTGAAVVSDAVTIDQINKVQAIYQPQIEAAQQRVDALAPVYRRLCAQRQAILDAAPR
jgi:hypothetical protein